MEDSYLGMLHDDPFAQYNYYGSQVYVNVPAASPGPSSAQFVHPYVHPSQPSTSTSANFTTTRRVGFWLRSQVTNGVSNLWSDHK